MKLAVDNQLSDSLRRAGCLATFLLALAFFFLLGALVTLLNGDITGMLQAVLLVVLAGGAGVWLTRRNLLKNE
jgi:hypothetical protein